MADCNSVLLSGEIIGTGPQLGKTTDGNAVCVMGVRVTTIYTRGAYNNEETPVFGVFAFYGLGKTVSKLYKSGDRVRISGALRIEDGKTVIEATNVGRDV